jgi:HEAT repeat protein
MLNEVKSRLTGKAARFLTAVLLAAVLTGSVYAQKNSIKDVTTNKHALENLVAGIHSDNTGVKRSAIYFAGKYRIAETEEALIAQLKEENDPSTRILIAIVLYEMGSEEGLLEVKDLSMRDKDAKVRRMAAQIYNEYLVNDSNTTAFVTE